MDYRPYIAGVLLLGSVACIFLVVTFMRRRRAAAGRSGFRSSQSLVGRHRSRDDVTASRSLTEMLDYYAPIDSNTQGVAPNGASDETADAEVRSAAKDVADLLESDGMRPSASAPSAPAFVHVRSVSAPAPSGDPAALRLLAPVPPPVTQADDSRAETARSDEPLSAPVEIWFEDGRVGVEQGSKTHRQFLKYADALLGDLKATRSDTR